MEDDEMGNNPLTSKAAIEAFEARNLYLSMFNEIDKYEFYRYVFPEGSFSPFGQPGVKKPNGILRRMKDPDTSGNQSRDYLVFDDLQRLELATDYPFALMAPIAYSGKKANSKNAYVLHGFVFDIDDVSEDNLKALVFQAQNKVIPFPTFICSSGGGVHLYYIFDEPEPLQNYKRKALTNLKRALTRLFWDDEQLTSKKQTFQGLYQMYRMPGSLTKLGEGYCVRAFRVGERISIKELNDFVDPEFRADYSDHLTLAEAAVKYPEWFANLGNPTKKSSFEFPSNSGLYNWWLANLITNATKGNRYWCVVALFVFAKKCDVPLEQAREDALKWIDELNMRSADDAFTEEDVNDAASFYNDKAKIVRRSTIEAWTGIKIEPAKRNTGDEHRKRSKVDAERINQKCALEENAWPVRDELYPDGTWRGKRPKGSSKERKMVLDWRREHQGEPKFTRKRCAEELGINAKTVGRWWNDDLDIPWSEHEAEKAEQEQIDYSRAMKWMSDHQADRTAESMARDLNITRASARKYIKRAGFDTLVRIFNSPGVQIKNLEEIKENPTDNERADVAE